MYLLKCKYSSVQITYVCVTKQKLYIFSLLSEYNEIPNSTAELNNFIEEAATQNLPFESHCVMPIVFDNACEMEPIDFINEGADLLHDAGKRFIPHVSPYVSTICWICCGNSGSFAGMDMLHLDMYGDELSILFEIENGIFHN